MNDGMMGIARALNRLLGLLCVGLAALLGLFAILGYSADNTGESRTVAVVFGSCAVLLLVIGLRWLRHGDGSGKRTPRAPAEAADSPVLVVVTTPSDNI